MLVGRDEELRTVTRAVSAGPGVFIRGEAGVGKSSLVSHAVEASGRAVSTGQCFRSLSWSAGLPLQQAVGSPLSAGDPAWTAHWIAQRLRGRVLWLDDVQWADPLTRAVLPLLGPTTTLALTVRSGDPGAEAALAVAAEAGLAVHDLRPLAPPDATALALDRHPRLRRAEARALAERCGGNPLLIEELGRGGEPSAGLRRTVIARLRRLGPAAWHGFALLAIAGEPLPATWLTGLDALTGAGFVVSDDGDVRPRLSMYAESVIAELADDPARSAVAAELARLARAGDRLALAARAFDAAGRRDAALAAALEAVDRTDRPGQRAGLLYIAATCADGEIADDLAARAVEQLVTSGQYEQAAVLLDRVPHADDARWEGLRGRILWQLGDNEGTLAAFERGLAVADADAPERVLLAIEHARAVLLGLVDVERGLHLAQVAFAEAERTGIERARALAVLATAGYYSGRPEATEQLERAVDLAVAGGDVMVEFTSANNLISVHESAGRLQEAATLAERFAARAGSLRLREWQVQMQAMALNARMHLGDYDPILAAAPVLLAGALDRRTRDQLEVTLALVLIDLGRHEAAIERLDPAEQAAADDQNGRGNLLWARAEAHLWAGDGVAARDDALRAMEYMHGADQRMFPVTTLAHARLLIGEPVAAEDWPASTVRMLDAAPHELAGLVARSAGEPAAAAGHFAMAAAAWSGFHRRGELRSRWLAADCEPDQEAARAALQQLETELAAEGWLPLLGRVRRSLRARGVRSGAPRGRTADGLTAREREVIDLVAEGLSNEAIATRLGLSASTVAAQIASARARLGASSRWQAASG